MKSQSNHGRKRDSHRGAQTLAPSQTLGLRFQMQPQKATPATPKGSLEGEYRFSFEKHAEASVRAMITKRLKRESASTTGSERYFFFDGGSKLDKVGAFAPPVQANPRSS